MSGDSSGDRQLMNVIVGPQDRQQPIHRCPTEILQCIFENILPPILPYYSQDPQETQWWHANQLCLVCRHWRDVALATPSLWTSIQVPLDQSSESIASYWRQATQRVKSAPAIVLFERVGAFGNAELHRKMEESFRLCSLRAIPRIHTLRLNVVMDRYPFDVLSLITEFPSSQLERLEVVGAPPDSGNGPDPSQTWNSLLHRFPPFRALKLTYVGPVIFSPLGSFPALVDLCILDAPEINITTILAACPNLERLSVDGTGGIIGLDVSSVDLPSSALPHLQFLDVGVIDNFPWSRLGWFPRLSEFKLRTRVSMVETPQVVMDFIQAHPSITSLSLRIQNPRFLQLISIAPQLVSISLQSVQIRLQEFLDWKGAGMGGPAFPKLQTAEFLPFKANCSSVNLQDFETFVRKRCLPASHPESALEVGIEPLCQLTLWEKGEWLNSKYMESTTAQHISDVDWFSRTRPKRISWV